MLKELLMRMYIKFIQNKKIFKYLFMPNNRTTKKMVKWEQIPFTTNALLKI